MPIDRKAQCVLIVEDEMLVAMHLEDMITDLGHTVARLVGHLSKAIDAAQGDDIDLAVLDVNLRGKESYPIADALRERNIPFLFTTGYGGEGMPERFREVTVLNKPVDVEALERALNRALGGCGKDA